MDDRKPRGADGCSAFARLVAAGFPMLFMVAWRSLCVLSGLGF